MDLDDVTRITDVGLYVVDTKLIKDTYMQPFNHFGEYLVEVNKFE